MHVYLDLDDTLIETQDVFEHYKNKCYQFIRSEARIALSMKNVLEYFNHRELINMSIYGFSNNRFVISWAETYRHFVPKGEKEKEVMALAEGVFYHHAPLINGAEDVLSNLKEKGYRMSIVTAGQEDIQQRRVDEVGIRDHFDNIFVLPHKTKKTMKQVIRYRKPCVMIGNSIKTDINPSIQLGIPAIHVKAKNWFFEEEPVLKSSKLHFGELADVPFLVDLIKEVTFGQTKKSR